MGPILVTGANGFVGTALCEALRTKGVAVVAAVRQGQAAGQTPVGDLTAVTDWTTALTGCNTVIHLAARVHVMSDKSEDPLQAYRATNVDATLRLARQAVAAGVKRFVFVSSVKVNGEATRSGRPFSSATAAMPMDPYGQSKLEAEAALFDLGKQTGLDIVVVRPPLVYGPGVKANFLNLVKLVAKGLPLPFGSVKSLRSMVALDNLVDLLIRCAEHPRAPGGVFMVSDGVDLTVGGLVRLIAEALDKKIVLLPVPPPLMRGGAALLGKSAVADRLLGSLQVDIAKTRELLGWEPPVTPQSAIRKTVVHFLANEGRKN